MQNNESGDIHSLNQLLDRYANSQVIVIGDIMLDRFVYGHVERISPESPVPILNISHEDEMLGGAGNALSNLAGLGVQAHMISIIGDDMHGQTLSKLIQDLGFDNSGLVIDHNRPTTIKTRFLAAHQQLLRADHEHKSAVNTDLSVQIIEKLKAKISKAGAIILSDYGKGLLQRDLIQEVMKLAKAHNIPVIVDPKGHDYSLYKGASAITPNKKELSEGSGIKDLSSDKRVVEAAQKIIAECGIEAVIATRSGEGMSVIKNDGSSAVHIEGSDIEVFDVSGAGDTVIATIAASLAANSDLVEAAILANMAGSIVVTKVGTAPIRLEELKEALAHEDVSLAVHSSGKERFKQDRAQRGDILGWEQAAEQIKRWKARGLKVGFTNGCFDILHYGHVNYLNQARDRCDRLVMGLNKDSSIRILKGPERPVHDEQSRAHVLAALGSIDLVVMFGAEKEGDDNTASALIEALKPDIYFKGGDYIIDQIPEAPTVIKNGGVVEVMPVYDGHSTTNSIKKIKAS